MNTNLKLYTINTDYINYLKRFQHHIWDNEEKSRLRPYVGIVFEIDKYKYYAPLSSPKQKHDKMRDGLDFIKIEYKNELKCVINLNNMIPVDDSDLSLIDIENEESLYANLLSVEIIGIRKKKDIICNNARILHNKVTKHRNEKHNEKLIQICYNFLFLEQNMSEYIELKEIQAVKDMASPASE
jgi:protein AbiQ